MPVYKSRPDYFHASVQSALDQTFGDFELIISDNGSPSETAEMYDEVARSDPRVSVIHHEENRGALFNFAFCASLGTGEYVLYVADDDLRAPTYLEKAVRALDAHPDAVGAHSRLVRLGEHGDHLGPCGNSTAVFDPRRWRRVSDLDGHPVYGLLRRSALQKVGPMKAIAGGDILLALELALIGRWVLIDEELFFYRVNVKASWEVQRDRLAGNSKIKGDTAAWAHLRRALIGAVQEAPLSHFERTLCLTALVGGFVRRGWLMRDAVIRRHNRLEEHVARRRYGAALIESVPYVLMQPSRAMERRFWRSAFERLRAERRRRP